MTFRLFKMSSGIILSSHTYRYTKPQYWYLRIAINMLTENLGIIIFMLHIKLIPPVWYK